MSSTNPSPVPPHAPPTPDQASPPQIEERGQTTISPLSNRQEEKEGKTIALPALFENLPVQLHPVAEIPPREYAAHETLAHGLDWLDLSLTLDWGAKPPPLFASLAGFKELAKAKANQVGQDDGTPCRIHGPDTLHWWACVHGWGRNGYEWHLSSKEMSWHLMSNPQPCARPSLLVHFSPLALWTHGPLALLNLLAALLAHHGATIKTATVSRMDLTLDMMTREGVILNAQTPGHAVARAKADQTHRQHRKVNAFGIGSKGAPLTCRIYDKVLELKKNPEKAYIGAVWGFAEPPAGYQVARIEFQLRRQAIRQFLPTKKEFAGLDEIIHVLAVLPQWWGYLTGHWLRFVDNPGDKRERQEDLPWWFFTRIGWPGAQEGNPLVRDCSAGANATSEMLAKQITGCLLTMEAIQNPVAPDADIPKNLPDHLGLLAQKSLDHVAAKNGVQWKEKLTTRRAKHHRLNAKKEAKP